MQWFEYAGLAVQEAGQWSVAPEGTAGVGELLGGRIIRRVRGGFPHDPPGPSLGLLVDIARGSTIPRGHRARSAAWPLLVLGALVEDHNGEYHLRSPDLVVDGTVVPAALMRLLLAIPGVPQGLAVIEADPRARPEAVGQAVKTAIAADWSANTTAGIGKHLRAWARAAGLRVDAVPRAAHQARTRNAVASDNSLPSLFSD